MEFISLILLYLFDRFHVINKETNSKYIPIKRFKNSPHFYTDYDYYYNSYDYLDQFIISGAIQLWIDCSELFLAYFATICIPLSFIISNSEKRKLVYDLIPRKFVNLFKSRFSCSEIKVHPAHNLHNSVPVN